MAVSDEITTNRTPAGIPVVVERLPDFHSASLSVYFGTGSRDEEERQSGIAHMLEHMLFKGTTRRTAREMSEQIEAAGGEMNGYTTKEVTSYQVCALDETVDVAEDILADMVLNPSLDASCLATEKNVVLQEINMLQNDPDDYIHDLFAETLWGDHPMGRSEAGSSATVSSLSERDVKDFFQRHYRPPRMAVVAVGNVDPAQVVEWASQSFDGLAPAPPRRERTAPRPNATFRVCPREDRQAYVGMGFPGCSSVDPERFALRLTASILGMGTSSRLFQEIREKEGLVYEIFATSGSYTDCGAVSVFFNTSVKDQERVVRLVAREVRRLKEEGLVKGELERAKHLLKGVYVRKLESSETRMVRLGEMFMSTGEAVAAEETLRRMDAVTEEDVHRMARELMRRDRLCMALHAPGKESERAARDLADLDF
jgi:predicted Zn-dependent peptidase